MKFGYAILYVDDVEKTVSFYEQAFGLKRKMVVPGEFGELETGSTRLAFAARTHATTLFTIPIQEGGVDEAAPPMEIALVTPDVAKAFDKAVAAGAIAIAEPAQKPWGQTVAYVRDDNGFLVELCTPIE
jgi:catechol 2,3-dioxygenase-like lactoylglutathione lyase family enzyme